MSFAKDCLFARVISIFVFFFQFFFSLLVLAFFIFFLFPFLKLSYEAQMEDAITFDTWLIDTYKT